MEGEDMRRLWETDMQFERFPDQRNPLQLPNSGEKVRVTYQSGEVDEAVVTGPAEYVEGHGVELALLDEDGQRLDERRGLTRSQIARQVITDIELI